MKAGTQTSEKLPIEANPRRRVPDAVKWSAAWIVLGAALFWFYWYASEALPLRIIGLLAAAVVFVLIAARTDSGHTAWGFVRDARTEVRKVVWPTRQETVQTTLIVLAVVIAIAAFLAIVDAVLGIAVHYLLGGGG